MTATTPPSISPGTHDAATPGAAAILSSIPGIATVLRDASHRILCCNDVYAHNTGRSREDLLGTTHDDLRPGPAAEERVRLMSRIIEQGRARDFMQFWNGKTWLCRILPLDSEAYGMRGTLSVIMQAPIGTALADRSRVEVLETADFGDLDKLTPAEKRTIRDLAMGLSNNEIAERQGRSVRTIECHVRAIHEKLGTSSRSAIIRDASERGIQLFTEEQWDAMVDAKRTRRPARRRSPVPPTGANGVIEAKG
jgi:DNA-binding CsgD family transcriptional regulator